MFILACRRDDDASSADRGRKRDARYLLNAKRFSVAQQDAPEKKKMSPKFKLQKRKGTGRLTTLAKKRSLKVISSWKNESRVSRLTYKRAGEQDKQWKRRCGALGNAIVPLVARVAFMHLVLGSRAGPVPKEPTTKGQLAALQSWVARSEAEMGKAMKEGFRAVFKESIAADIEEAQKKGARALPVSKSESHGGAMVNGSTVLLSPLDHLLSNFLQGAPSIPKGGIKLRGNGRRSSNPAQTTAPVSRRTIRHWATPRHGQWGCTRVLTSRSVRDLHTQFIFSADQKDSGSNELIDEAYPNPAFVEWMMGYPAGWTKLEN